MLKNLFSILIMLIVASFLQGCGSTARLKKADKRFESGAYFSAAEAYKRAYSGISSKDKALRARVSFNMGECYRVLNYSIAEQNYVNAIRFNYPDSIVFLRYAQVLHRNGNYKEAEKNYQIFARSNASHTLAANGADLLKMADAYKKQPTAYVVKKFDVFNYRRSHNFSPSFQGTDGDVLFFNSDRSVQKKAGQKNSLITGLPISSIYTSRKNATGVWDKPAPLVASEGKVVSSEDGVCAFSNDGNTMFFTRSSSLASSNAGTSIYQSKRAGGAWSEAKKINLFKDSTISVAHPAISPDGNKLIFVSDARGGKGGKDLWSANFVGGEFKEIENLGSYFNTEGDEMFPSFAADGTLYFASNGLAGLGGLDLFKATELKSGSWVVENLGMPINSSSDDFGITFEGKLQKGFFSSNRGDARGYDMIYSFELPVFEYVIEGKVTDELQEPVAEAIVRLVSNTGINTKVQTKKDGTFRIRIDKELDLVLLATGRGYLNKSARLNTLGATKSQTYTQNFVLQTIYKPIQVDNIFYEFGKWDLTAQSETGLQALVTVLNDNPSITIEVAAHTDFVGNNLSNIELSTKRAQSVVSYLIDKGIDPKRLSSVGYGEDKPFVVDALTVKKYSFLKEGDVLTESFIENLLPAQQEQANQINRRTEFRVVKTSFK